MISTSSKNPSLLIRASLVLCTGCLFAAMVTGSAKAETKAVAVPAANVVMGPAIFGSSAGQASIKAAPTTWSSRSEVRWNARWTTTGRYLV